jgi:UDP-N-acetylmuramate dehydrogenase
VLIQESVPLAPRTTIRLGGPARYFCACADEGDVREALEAARRRSPPLPVRILGGGSNVLFPDAGFPGLVAHIAMGGVSFQALGESAVLIEAGAGVSWDSVVAESVTRGLAGIECLSGIPGTVGGAPIQNIGAYGQEIADTLVEVDCLDRTRLTRVTLDREACAFSYRMSRFKAADRDRYVVLAVRLRLERAAPPVPRYPELAALVVRRGAGGIDRADPAAAVALVRESVLELRRGKSMVLDPADPNTRSVGSFFLNPVLSEPAFAGLARSWRAGGGSGDVPHFPTASGVKVPAAWLVEQAGFRKGYRRGDVGLSTRHALALVNYGGTTASLLALAEEIERTVLERFGVKLEREAVVVPG